MCKIFLTCVLVATAAITYSAKSSWPTSTSDDICLTSSQASKYPASKFPKYPSVGVEPVGSWPTR